MKYTRIQRNTVEMENSISFRQYVEGLEERYREDRQAFKEELQRSDERRAADNEKAEKRRIADNEKAEKSRKEDFAKFQEEIATFKIDLNKTFRNNIFIPLIIALVVVIAGLFLPIALSNWRDFIAPPQTQPTTETVATTE
ncbi:MAG: hypothetical protein FWG68_06430 [Defluviitaleaceae bacterium]|nr:hypothetical protein [Defluviitaleaceae bacterium]